MKKCPKKNVNVVLPLELYDVLNDQAEASCRSLPGYIRQILKRYLAHLEVCPDPLEDWWAVK